MDKTYFTITGCDNYFGNLIFKTDMVVHLEKEPTNKFDKEAIIVKIPGLGKVGYVANSCHTVLGESNSAGRIYDKISDVASGKVLFIFNKGIVCQLTQE